MKLKLLPAQTGLTAALFDLSGTLLDSLKKGDRDVLDGICTKYAGQTYMELRPKKDPLKSIRRNFTNFFGARAEQAHDEYIEALIEALPLSELFDGAADTLFTLQENGLKLAAVSNRPTRYTEIALQHYGIFDAFDTVVSGDTVPGDIEKPDPAIIEHALNEMGLRHTFRSRVAMVGDTVVDVKCADGARVMPVLFSDKEVGTLDIQARLLDKSKLPLTTVNNYEEVKTSLLHRGRHAA